MTVNSANYHTLDEIISNHPKIEEIGSKRSFFSHFFGRRVYLSHDQDGWSLKILNIFQRIFRSFSFYKSTHLSTITKALDSDHKQNRLYSLYTSGNNEKVTGLIQKIERLWNKNHRKTDFPFPVNFNDPEYLSELQKKLSRLTLDVNPPLAKPVPIDEDQKEKYLAEISSPSHQELMRKVIDHHITHISMGQFLSALRECVVELNDCLKDQPETSRITLFTVPGKSQIWVGCLALRYMNRYPNEHHAQRLNGGKFQGICTLTDKQRDIVIFDDCSYSGSQLCNELRSLKEHYSYFSNNNDPDYLKNFKSTLELTEEKKQNLYFVVPYMTSAARKRFEETKQSIEKEIPHVKIQLITRHSIPTIGELLLTESEFDMLQDLGLYKSYDTSSTFSYMDWKKPDYVSMPVYFAEGQLPAEYRKSEVVKCFRFIPEIEKPYKDFLGRYYFLSV